MVLKLSFHSIVITLITTVFLYNVCCLNVNNFVIFNFIIPLYLLRTFVVVFKLFHVYISIIVQIYFLTVDRCIIIFNIQEYSNSFTVLSLNVNGFSDYARRKKLISKYLYQCHTSPLPDVICLQETHTVSHNEKRILVDTNFDLCFAHRETVKGGLITGFHRNLDYVVSNHAAFAVQGSQMLVVECSILKKEYVIVNCYVNPRDHFQDVLSFMLEALVPYLDSDVIMCGDFNAVLDTNIDRQKASESSQIAKSVAFNNFVDHLQVYDLWRLFNPESQRFTHFPAARSGSRLDYIFMNGSLVNSVLDSRIGVTYVTDHCLIYVDVNTGRELPGKGFWKFPSFLLHDKSFEEFLKPRLDELKEHNKEANPALLWDTLKCEIRSAALSFMKLKNQEKKFHIEEIETTIADLNYLKSQTSLDGCKELMEDIHLLENTLDTFYIKKNLQYNIGKKENENETSSKYFFTRTFIPGSTSMLYNDNCEEVTDGTAILDICKQFYDTLYFEQGNDFDTQYDFLPPVDNARKLTLEQINLLDEEITQQDLYKALKKMKPGTMPGTDGLTVEFYLQYWNLVGEYVFNSIDYAKQVGHFSISQKRGIIKLIPKKNKNPHFVKHLRPITLLNIDYKLLTRTLALQLAEILNEILRPDQSAFVQRRFIGNNILDLYSIMATAEDNNEEAVLILLDIEKAFDTINWSFIRNVLVRLGFPSSFVHWLDAMKVGKELRILNNGHSSEPIYPGKGVAQGCALSPLIFILGMEMLANVIRNNETIQGVKCETLEKKIALAADDTLLVCQATESCFSEVNSVLDEFARVSGLKVNYTKSNVVRLGVNKHKGPLLSGTKFKWSKPEELFTYLGIKLNTVNSFTNQNFPIDPQIVTSATNTLRYDFTSILGKILLLKSLVVSKFVYRLSLLPALHHKVITALEKLYYNYVWAGGHHRVSVQVMEQPIKKGGFNMINIQDQQSSLKLIWLQRILDSNNLRFFWQEQIESVFRIPIHVLLKCNLHFRKIPGFVRPGKTLPLFWSSVLQLYFKNTYVPSNKIIECSYSGNLSI